MKVTQAQILFVCEQKILFKTILFLQSLSLLKMQSYKYWKERK
jgi:hypothetical protein